MMNFPLPEQTALFYTRDSDNCSIRRTGRMGVILLTSLTVIIVGVTRLSFEARGSRSRVVIDSLQPSCSLMMDTMDRQFDQRRKARQDQGPSRSQSAVTQFDLFEPESTCFSEERFGAESNTKSPVKRYSAYGDGPKFVCGVNVIAAKAQNDTIASDDCLVYSIGSNNDIRFEKAVHTFMHGCEIHTFDPTLTKPFIGGDYATFHPWGLGVDGETSENQKWTSMSMEHIIKKLGHVNRTIDILKIDCEGCEYSTMPPVFELIASGQIQVNQVQVELHLPRNYTKIGEFFQAADNAALRIFHKERNHWGCNGFKCVEYSLISESFLRESNAAVVCPLQAASKSGS